MPHFHILRRKELENYLLVPAALAEAIADRLSGRGDCDAKIPCENVEEMIDEITGAMKSGVLSQTISNRMRYFANRTARDPATVASEAITGLDNDWVDLERRMAVVPGKQLLSSVNTMLQRTLGISISTAQIISKLKPDMMPDDLQNTLRDINEFAK